MRDDFLWVEKYRPRKVRDTILPERLKQTFQTFIDQGNVPNLLLTGRAGVGKTTVARAMLDELGCDYLIINGSMERNIDTLRNDIHQFASSMSLQGGRKMVILDEADYLNSNSTQPALRNFMEQFSKNCGFILTCNYKNKIIPELHSRCSVVEFNIDKKDRPKMAAEVFARVCDILEKEDIEYKKKVVAEVVSKFFPDNRRILNELQRYSTAGVIDEGILTNLQEISLKSLVGYIKEKDFVAVRKWVAENGDMDTTAFFRTVYDSMNEYVVSSSIPVLVLILGEYQFKAAFVADQEVNTAACLVEIMKDVKFK